MDPQLTKQLIRRRMILENALETSIKEENTKINIEVSSLSAKDIIQCDDVKNNFLEKIKKFESFSDNQIKTTHQTGVDKPRNNIDISNKLNKSNKDIVLKKTIIRNKLELEFSEGFFSDHKQQDNFHEKIKQFESSFKIENKILNENSFYVKEYPQLSNDSKKSFKMKCSSSKSDYNNWKLDKNWVFYRDYSHLNKHL